jgi:hypothetical protein
MIVDDTVGRDCTHARATEATLVPSLCDAHQFVDDREIALGEKRFHAIAAIGIHRRRVRARVFSGQHAATKRRPRRDAEAELRRHRRQVAFDRALDQRIFNLQRDERRPAVLLRGHVCLDHLPRRRIRHTDVADFAGPHQVVERARTVS